MNIVLHFLGFRGGGGRTDAINLLRAMPAVSPQYNFLAIVPAGCGYEQVLTGSNCRLHFEPVRPLNNLWRLFFDNVSLKRICEKFQADVLFTMCNNGPVKIKTCRHVIMIRRSQLVYPLEKFGEYCIKKSSKYRILRWYLKQSLRYADALICQTNTIEKLILDAYDVKCPVYVVGKTISQNIRTDKSRENACSRQLEIIKNCSSKFKLLYLTKYYPHKNIERACEAMAQIRRSGVDVTLFLTLNKAESAECKSLLEKIDKEGFSNAVINIGSVDLADIESVYQNCDAVLMPSLLESYSATYLEAMAFGKPLLASDREFAREICGNAALYFDPLNIDSIAYAIQNITANQELREKLMQKGQEQFLQFNSSWEDIAMKYINILENCDS